MPDVDPFNRYGLMNQQVDSALATLDSYRPQGAPGYAPPVPAPIDASAAPGAVNTLQPLSPGEQALGAQFAAANQQQAANSDANATQAGYTHQAMPAAPPPVVSPGTPGLDWQPTPQAPQAPVQGVFAGQPTTPGSQLPQTNLEMPQLGAMRRSGIASPKSPLPRLQTEASGRAQEAEGAANAAQDQQTTADEDLIGSQRELGDVHADTQEDVAGIHNQLGADAAHHQKLVDQQNHGYQAAAVKTEQESREIANQIKTFQPKDRRSMSTRVSNALAVFLGGVGDAFMAAGGHQGNAADGVVQMINQNIQRDLDEQQAMLSNHKTALAAKNDELGHLYQRWGASDTALKGAWLMKLDQAEQSLKGVLASGSSREAKALATESIAKIQGQRAETERALQMGLHQQNRAQADQLTVARYNEQKAAAVAAANAPYTAAKRQLELEKLMAETGKTKAEAMKLMGEARGAAQGPYLGKDVTISDPQAFQAWAASKPASASVEKLQQAVQGMSELSQSINAMRKLKTEHGSENETFNSAAGRSIAATMNAHREQLISSLGKMKDGSVIQEAEYKRWLDMVPGAEDYTDGAIARLNAIEQAAQTRINGTLRQVGGSFGSPAAARVRQGAVQ